MYSIQKVKICHMSKNYHIWAAQKLTVNIVGVPPKGGFFFRKCNSFFKSPNLQNKKYSKKLSWAWNLNLLSTVIGGKLKFQVQDSFLEYFYLGDWEIWKTHRTFWKKNLWKKYFIKWKSVECSFHLSSGPCVILPCSGLKEVVSHKKIGGISKSLT